MPEHKENLFKEFPRVSAEQWREQIEKDLKGKSADTLKWEPYEGFTVEPFYTQRNLERLEYLSDSVPGEFPFIRGCGTENNDWEINEYITESDIESANKSAVESIRMGAQSITFYCNNEVKGSSGLSVQNEEDMSSLLKDIPIEEIPVHFKCGTGASKLLSLYVPEAEKRGISPKALIGSVDTDPVGEFILSGSLPEDAFGDLKSLIERISGKLPGFTGIKVRGEIFGDSGGSIAQELAYSLSSGVEYIDKLSSMDLTPEQIQRHMAFSYSVGSNYFMEIAKLRAARLLWALILKQYEIDSPEINIESVSSNWNLSTYDPYTNMLRGTVAAMAATIGGSGSVHIAPLDSAYENPGDFTRRMARNTQLLLKSESYIDRVIDPSAGSYYIENLTDSLAEEAWELFLEVEGAGGIIEALRSGLIQEKIEETRTKKDKDLQTGKATLLGVNRYPNMNEEVPALESIDSLSNKSHEIRTLKPYRAAEPFEMLRQRTENYTGNKDIFLLPLGNPAMRTARAGFSANFFGCGGFGVIDRGAFDNRERGIEEAVNSGALIVVLCSSDKEYPELAPGVCEKLKAQNPDIRVIVAGNPRDHIDELKEAGVDDFIHVRTNILETLRKYQGIIGI